MTIIHGNSETGKSTIARILLRNKKNSLYLILDNDTSIINHLKKDKIDFYLMDNCFLMDIKYRLLERGGLINNDLEYVVIDSINFIRDKKKYKEKIKYIEEMANDFNIQIILVINTIKTSKKIEAILDSLECHKKIDVKKINQQMCL